MATSRIRQRFFDNWVAIVLTVVSIIQGLAFNNLADNISSIITYTIQKNDFSLLAHFILSFIILLRVFQTYITAALDYDEWLINFFDVFLIFIIGAVEFYIFSSLHDDFFLYVEYQRRLILILIIAVFGHARAFVGIKEENFDTYEEYRKETKLQITNMLSMLSILAISIFAITSKYTILSNGATTLALVQSCILAYSIYYSLISTFKFTIYSKEIKSNNLPAISEVKQIEVIIRQAERKDVSKILELMLKNFYYVYGSLFGTNLDLTERILKKIIISNKGKHNLGYRAFNVALEKQTGEVVGLLMASKNTYSSKYFSFITFLSSFYYILINLGFFGVFRALNNFRTIRTAIPEPNSHDYHIVYIAVSDKFQNQGIGDELIEYAKIIAKNMNYDNLSCDVRSENTAGLNFFKRNGFQAFNKIESQSDAKFKGSYRVHLKKSI